MKRKYIFMLLCLFANGISAQNNTLPIDSITVYFHVGKSDLDLSFHSNKRNLFAISDEIKGYINLNMQQFLRVSIRSGASPEGSVAFNNALSQKRADVLIKFLKEHTTLRDDNFKVETMGVDWQGLILLVSQSSDMPFREEMLSVLKNAPLFIVHDGIKVPLRQKMMEEFGEGVPYKWMLEHIFPKIRHTSIVIKKISLISAPVISESETLP